MQRKCHSRALTFFISCLCLLVIFSPVGGAETGPQPLIPHSFYGSVTAAGSPVPAGVLVEAHGEGVKTGIAGNPVYSHEGSFGSPDPFKQRLEVQGDILPGTSISFSVGGIPAELQVLGREGEWLVSYPYTPGSVTELALRVAVPVTPDPRYHETEAETLPRSPVTSTPGGGINPSQGTMMGLVIVLVLLGGLAYVLGRRAERTKKGQEQKEGPGESQKEETGPGRDRE
ncbi:MAG: hypothetical protein NQU46_00535 [Methanolinea sp.]|nr:hypothetical protein [Methanolinea sp.]